jgi:hypothetical protein
MDTTICSTRHSRRHVITLAGSFLAGLLPGTFTSAADAPPDKFDFLSKNGNSSCGGDFLNSIAGMPATDWLQGSCCSPMERPRYSSQIEGLKKYAGVSDIPPDPYDIEAPLAQKLLPYYDLTLTPEEQKAYDYAMANSAEKGPCCCRRWRWKVFGGLGKLLIREHGFDGLKVTDVWNLSDGCGGGG